MQRHLRNIKTDIIIALESAIDLWGKIAEDYGEDTYSKYPEALYELKLKFQPEAAHMMAGCSLCHHFTQRCLDCNALCGWVADVETPDDDIPYCNREGALYWEVCTGKKPIKAMVDLFEKILDEVLVEEING